VPAGGKVGKCSAGYLFLFHSGQYMKAFVQCGRGDGWLEYCGAAASAAGSC
jgi:hypothetical protein